MKHVLGAWLLAWGVFGVGAGQARASVFVDLVEFGGPEIGPGDLGSVEVRDNVVPPTWLHDLADDLGGATPGEIEILAASLAVSYRGTNGVEVWTLLADGHSLGTLASTNTAILTTEFPLGADALAGLSADGLLEMIPKESTTGIDRFRLYSATLTGEYQRRAEPDPEPAGAEVPAPEPATGCLFGIPILGWFFGRRRKV